MQPSFNELFTLRQKVAFGGPKAQSPEKVGEKAEAAQIEFAEKKFGSTPKRIVKQIKKQADVLEGNLEATKRQTYDGILEPDDTDLRQIDFINGYIADAPKRRTGGSSLVINGKPRQARGINAKIAAQILADSTGTIEKYRLKLNAAQRAKKLMEEDREAMEKYAKSSINIFGEKPASTTEVENSAAYAPMSFVRHDKSLGVADISNPANMAGPLQVVQGLSMPAAKRIFG